MNVCDQEHSDADDSREVGQLLPALPSLHTRSPVTGHAGHTGHVSGQMRP